MLHSVHILDFEEPMALRGFLGSGGDAGDLTASPDRLLLRLHSLADAEWRAARRAAGDVHLAFRTDRDPARDGRYRLSLPGSVDRFAAWIAALEPTAPTVAAEARGVLAAHATTRWTWRVRGRELRVGPRTLVMGVVNVTPDSFSDGGRYLRPEDAVRHGLRLAADGADLLDVGGESTRPGARRVPAAQEAERVLPVIRGLARATDVPISVDTSCAEVAEAALDAGARAVNDVSALAADSRLGAVVAAAGAGLVLMHMRGTPATMQRDPRYDDVHREVIDDLRAGLARAAAAGVDPEQTVVDPGIGFGKRLAHNLALLRHAGTLRALGRPVLVGASRKSFLGELTGRPVDARLAGSLAAVAAAFHAGASIVRVHDVAETVDLVRTLEAIREAGPA